MKNKYDQDLQEANATIQQLQDQLAGVAFPVSSHVVREGAEDAKQQVTTLTTQVASLQKAL